MKVAVFTDNDFSKVNGVTTTLRAVLEHAPDDLDIRVYACDDVEIETDDYLSLAAFGVGIPFYTEMKMYAPPVRRLLAHASAAGTEVVHLTTPGPVGLAALWVADRLRVPLIGSFHTDLAQYARILSGSQALGTIVGRYLRWSYAKCSRIFTPSEATRNTLIRARIDPGTIEIWRRGVSTTVFDPTKRSQALRASWGVSESRPAIVYAGRLSREKGLDAFAIVSRHLGYAGVAHRLVLIGDGPMRRELEALCPDAVFMGMLRSEDVGTALASGDVFLFPSRTDTAGNVVLEAQASGLPVLVSNVGGPQENLEHGRSGWICNDVVDFARRAADLLARPRKRRQFSERAREYALNRRWSDALEPLYRAYREIGVTRSDALHYPESSFVMRNAGDTARVA